MSTVHSRIGYGDNSLLAGILRAAACSEPDGMASPVLGGVHLASVSGSIRCTATDGKILARIHAWHTGIDLPAPVIIDRHSILRVADLYRRSRGEFCRTLKRRDPSMGGAPLVTARLEVRPPTNAGNRPLRFLHIQVPSTDDGCVCRCINGEFPAFEPQQEAYKRGFLPGTAFDPRKLVTAQRVLGTTSLTPYHGKRCVFFRAIDSDDFVLLMPISLPDPNEDLWIFGKPPAQETAA